jgi:acetyltransferase-like isoleucine patch superfamily enzyme
VRQKVVLSKKVVSPNAKIGNNTKIWSEELSNIQDCEIGNDSRIHSHVWIGNGVKIGNNVKIQAFSFIPDGVTIEDNCFIGPGVVFTNDKYPPSGGKEWRTTVVRQGASIGARAVILPGLTIGENAVVGAGSVVTKDVPPSVVVCGNPARIKAGRRNE